MAETPLPDFSAWLDENINVELAAWDRIKDEPQGYRRAASYVTALLQSQKDPVVLELCCGAGLCAREVDPNVPYFGVDNCEQALVHARSINPSEHTFIQSDIRRFDGRSIGATVVACFQALKHFGLHEWDEIFSKLLSLSTRTAVFTMNIAPKNVDDGVLWPHTWVTGDHIRNLITEAGMFVMHNEKLWSKDVNSDQVFLCGRRKDQDSVQI